MKTGIYLLSFTPLILSCLLFIRLRWPYNYFLLWFPQVLTGALSPFLIVLGGLGAIFGLSSDMPLATVAGGLGIILMTLYIYRVKATPTNLESVGGPGLQTTISRQTRMNTIQQHSTKPQWERNIQFWTIPHTDRKLLCDLWQPPIGVTPTGLAFVYFHGSAWYMLDKDFGTRPFFRHLVAQGHVIMDAAYRLCPEVDIFGMIGDIKRAIAWMKMNSHQYGVNPERVVIGGASAGGHLSLLAGYAPSHPQLTPVDVSDVDLSVRAIISFYGPSDLRAVYEYTRQERLINLPKVETGKTHYPEKSRYVGRLDILLGGHLHEVPHVYDLASPITHVHPGCPPTLLIQGDQDIITPVKATYDLHRKLQEAKVPAINVVYPQTNHAFDLFLPEVSPAARASLRVVDQFLARVE